MVDAAVGGKTGINTDEGKNLVGSFHPPGRGAVRPRRAGDACPCDELVPGLAEVVKHGFIADPEILELIETDPGAAPALGLRRAARARRTGVAVKARVVTADLRESELREILNYGHTFGHAVEQVEGYTWRHGLAVASEWCTPPSWGASPVDAPDLVERHRAVLGSLGLPAHLPRRPLGQLLTAMRRDKKSRGDLCASSSWTVSAPVRLGGPDPALLAAAYAEVTAS